MCKHLMTKNKHFSAFSLVIYFDAYNYMPAKACIILTSKNFQQAEITFQYIGHVIFIYH